jgi:hypothetical protein
MTIHFNTPPVHGGICAKRTNLAELRVLVAALVAATLGRLRWRRWQHPQRERINSTNPTPAWFCAPITWVSPPTRRALAASMRT